MNDETSGCGNRNKLPLCYTGRTSCIRQHWSNNKKRHGNLWKKTAPMCCIGLYLSCARHCLRTLWTIATSRLNWSRIKLRRAKDSSRVENMFFTAEFQGRITAPFGGSSTVQCLLASKSISGNSNCKNKTLWCQVCVCVCMCYVFVWWEPRVVIIHNGSDTVYQRSHNMTLICYWFVTTNWLPLI